MLSLELNNNTNKGMHGQSRNKEKVPLQIPLELFHRHWQRHILAVNNVGKTKQIIGRKNMNAREAWDQRFIPHNTIIALGQTQEHLDFHSYNKENLIKALIRLL